MPGLLRGMARTAVVAGTATAVSNRVSRRQAERWNSQEPDAQYEQPAENETTDDTDYQIEQLQKLGQLHDQGILTDEEFAAKKHQILGV